MQNTILNQLAPDLYEANASASVLGMQMGHRMVVIRLTPESGGGLWIHSPIAWSEALEAELDALDPAGGPRHLVIPSRTHDLHLEPWLERIPAATTYAPVALQRVHPDWDIGVALADERVAPWSGEIRQQGLRGAPRVSEVDFLHLPTKTLILTDCVFNLTAPRPFLGGLLLRLNACKQGICTTRIFRMTIKDQRAFGASIASMLRWDFERVLVGHGDVIEADGVPALREHLETFLEGFEVG